LNEDKRKAIEIIVEQRAGARDAEDADGNLPDLVAPRPRTTPNAESQERPDSEETEQT
jgi:hypothetical protein